MTGTRSLLQHLPPLRVVCGHTVGTTGTSVNGRVYCVVCGEPVLAVSLTFSPFPRLT